MFKFTCIAYNSSLWLFEHLMDYHLASKDKGSLFKEENVCDISLTVPSINFNKHCTCKSLLDAAAMKAAISIICGKS
jgi:hypothetical protein